MKLLKFLIILLLILGGIYVGGYVSFSDHFLPNTTINGIDVSFKDQATVDAEINDAHPVVTVIQKTYESNEPVTETIDMLSDAGTVISYDTSDLLKSQDRKLWFMSFFNENALTCPGVVTEFSQEMLDQKISELYCLQDENSIEPANAYIAYEGSEYVVIREDEGCYIDPDLVREKVNEACQNALNETINSEIDLSEFYEVPTVTRDDEYLNSQVTKLNNIINKTVTITVAGSKEYLDKSDMVDLLYLDGSELAIDYDELYSVSRSIANKYYVSDRKYIDRGTLSNRIAYVLLDESDGYVSIDYTIEIDRYVDVSISQQTLWYYENDELILTSPVVTGNEDFDCGTPTGTFRVRKMDRDCVLRGDDYTEYVDYWIGFDSTGTIYGLHDAKWRSEFGGDIYLTDPSHGCVNMPTGKIAELYDRLEVGATVYIHY